MLVIYYGSGLTGSSSTFYSIYVSNPMHSINQLQICNLNWCFIIQINLGWELEPWCSELVSVTDNCIGSRLERLINHFDSPCHSPADNSILIPGLNQNG